MSRDATGEVPAGSAVSAGGRLVSEPAFELLFSEIIAYTGAYVSHSAASHATDKLRASEAGVEDEEEGEKGGDDGDDGSDAGGSLVEPNPASVGAGHQLLPSDQAQQMEARIESMGYEVGYRLVERTCQRRWMGGDQLEAIKFVCKDLWSDLFKKQVDKLQTDHQGTFVLKDSNFRWTSRYAEDDTAGSRDLVNRLLQLPCGLVRGALANVGLVAVVRASFLDDRGGMSDLPAVSFTIKIRAGGNNQ
ncbi:unnamed protein product [Ectocarpus sp. 12 AP-2014]